MTNQNGLKAVTALWNKLDKHGKVMAWVTGACIVVTAPVGVGTVIYEAGRDAAYASVKAQTPEVVAPAPAPVVVAAPVAPAPVEVTYEMTWEEATAEMCAAVEQYRTDVAKGHMTRNGAFTEIREYSRYLASKSPMDAKTLRDNANYTFQWGARFCMN